MASDSYCPETNLPKHTFLLTFYLQVVNHVFKPYKIDKF